MTEFHKMHGLGNDFVVLDLRHQSLALDGPMAAALADRSTGIGCDQVLALHSPETGAALARLEIFNADGSRAEQCGNGVRCIGLYLHRNGETNDGLSVIDSPSGPIKLHCLDDGLVQVDMGPARFDAASIPVTIEPQNDRVQLETAEATVSACVVSMGNPHAVIEVEDLVNVPLATLGLAISTHPAFPEGCNAGFAQVVDRETIQLRVYERGSGETRACGSGACAAAAALARMGKTADRVRVLQLGGELIIDTAGEAGRIIMTGPASYVFKGSMQ